MASIFSKIIAGEIPCHKIAENEKFFAFLDINPLREGHTLVIPKVEIDYFFDIDDKLLSEMILFSKKVSVAIKLAIPCHRVGMMVIGFDIPHAHIHLIPINESSDMLPLNAAKLKPTALEFENTANKIRNIKPE